MDTSLLCCFCAADLHTSWLYPVCEFKDPIGKSALIDAFSPPHLSFVVLNALLEARPGKAFQAGPGLLLGQPGST